MYYSQQGEDFILDKMFENIDDGFFLEIGCIDGKRFSNSLYFENKGWDGICIEAHTDFISLLEQNRNCKIIHCAVGEKDDLTTTFYASERGTFSSLVNREERFKSSTYFTGYKEMIVEKLSLATILKKEQIKHVDFVSLDIEGYEIQALEGMDFSLLKPTVWVIENDNWRKDKIVDNILKKHGYYYIGRIHNNVYFSLDKKMRSLRNIKFNNVITTHTKHPIDAGKTDRVLNKQVVLKRFPRIKKIIIDELQLIFKKD